MVNIKSKIKNLILKATGQYRFLKKSVDCSYIWYGNKYGGFYLNPDLLNEDSIVYSFGIGEDISFDSAVIKNHSCHVFGFDPTPKSINWIKAQKAPDRFHFHEFGISDRSGSLDFYLPKNKEYVSGSLIVQENIDTSNKVNVQVKSLKDIMRELGHKHIDLLKMDIEGSEYDVIDNILSENISITQILIEFHGRFFNNGILKTRNSVDKLNKKGYGIFAIADSFEEISLVKRNALQQDDK